QDILSDGSHIEGCHKAWNALQRAQLSSIVTLTALSHGFVHHRNVQITFQCAEKTLFIGLTAGSHHAGLIGAITMLYNQL
ncbi:hypothetical protein EV363DRAFT_1119022, partial [Boletus edulis]